MSMEFVFAAGPAKEAGGFDEIFGADGIKPDFQLIETIGLPRIGLGAKVNALGLNIQGSNQLDRATNGAFFDFLDGDENQRYLRLAPRLPLLYALKEAVPHIDHVFSRMWAETFVENCEHALEAHGDKAILLIY